MWPEKKRAAGPRRLGASLRDPLEERQARAYSSSLGKLDVDLDGAERLEAAFRALGRDLPALRPFLPLLALPLRALDRLLPPRFAFARPRDLPFRFLATVFPP